MENRGYKLSDNLIRGGGVIAYTNFFPVTRKTRKESNEK